MRLARGMSVDYKGLVKKIGFQPKNGVVGIYEKQYSQHNYSIEIDFDKKQICYGNLIGADYKTTQNFSKDENWVVLECVDRLLEKGYKPQNITLEKTWAAGHGTSGRLDICVTRDDGSEYLLIECKIYGKEFEKAVSKLNKDGGQLFTYFKFSNKADVIMLYASELQNNEIIYKNEIVKIEDDYRAGDVKDFYEKWNKLTKDNGIFDSWVEPYCFESKALVKSQLKPINQEDSSFIFNRFLEILRHNVVSDKGNAFNKIFTLFLCKVYDETSKNDDEELDFQWKEGVDDHVKFQLRLTDLYKNGMEVFLSRIVSDFNEQEFENKYKHLSQETKNELLKEINTLRLEKNNEFAIKEVYDHDSFIENAKIVKEVIELLQGYRIRYNKRQQYLSDFFELLLTTGLKQEAGQFFTPVPIAQFIIKSLPLERIVDEKLKAKNGELLPYMIDYAAGSGHFITEYMHEVQSMIEKKLPNKYIEITSKKIKNWQSDPYDWATEYVYGVEKDYRLVKVGKVGCYLHGDGLANVILSDGLGNFVNTKDYKGKLRKDGEDNSKDNQQFDILLSNPPYSVSAFRQTTRDYYTEKDFDLYEKLTDNSSEIECLFVERTKQLLKDGGIAGIILPSSILTNTGIIYTKTRELLLKYFEIVAITELGSNTFMATTTNTVVLFLRRRNNYECINLEKSVENFIKNQTDVTINGIETPVQKYVNYVWEGLTFNDYLTLLNKEPNEKVKNHDLFKEYSNKIKLDKEFWNKVIELEKEKIYYFILAYPQKLVIVKTGEKDAEKQFLGYEFSNRRGSEGIHPIQRNKTIDECTKLFDINSFDNPQKASTYIYKAFENDFDFNIDETLKDNVSRIKLLDLMTFDRTDFEKNINLNSKKKVKIKSKYNIVKLSEYVIANGGNSFPKEYQNGKAGIPFLKVSDMNLPQNQRNIVCANNYVTISEIESMKAKVFDVNTIIFPKVGQAVHTDKKRILKVKACIDNNIMGLSTINDLLLPEYLYEIFVNHIRLSDIANSANPPAISATNIENVTVPLPPLDIQQKIVDEIEKVEKENIKTEQDIIKLQDKIKAISTTNAEYKKIEDYAILLKRGKSPKYSLEQTDIKILKSGQIRGLNNFDLSNVYYANQSMGIDERLLQKDDLLINSTGVGTAGRVNIFNLTGKYFVDSHVSILRLDKSKLLPLYVLYQLYYNIGFKNIEKMATGQSGQIELAIKTIANIKIQVPTLADQQKIVSQIEELEKQITEAQAIIDNSKQQKQEILDKYLK